MDFSENSFFKTFEELADAVWLTLQIVSVRDIKLPELSEIESRNYLMNDGIKEENKIDLDNVTEVIPIIPLMSTFSGNEVDESYVAVASNRVPSDAIVSQASSSNFSKIQFHRAIKPLKRQVSSSAVPRQLDIEETLYQLAKNIITLRTSTEENIQPVSIRSDLPVFASGKERWLDLMLVVDESLPMRFFQEQLQKIFKALEESGVFRDIQTLYIKEKKSDNGFPRPVLYRRDYLNQQEVSCSVSQLIVPTRRRVVLFLSGCTSKMWHDWTLLENDVNGPSIGKVLHELSLHYPVAILQMLPERLWLRSGIGYFEYCKASAMTPAAPNAKLKLSINRNETNDFAIPVLSFDSQRILSWSKMISGKSDTPVLSIYVSEKFTNHQRDLQNIYAAGRELKEHMDLFLSTAPKQAKQLAGYLSVMPDLTEKELDIVIRDNFSEVSHDLLSDLIANGLLDLKNGFGNEEKIIFGISGNMMDRVPLWDSITYSKRLEGMAYYYEFLAESNSKFLDKDSNQVSFWTYIDSRESQNITYNTEAGRQLFDLFETILYYSDGIEEIIYGKYVQEGDRASFDIKMKSNIELNNQSTENNEPLESVETLRNDSRSELKTFDFSRARPIHEQDYSYLSLPLLNIGVWGESGAGKTSFLMSMSRDLIIKEPRFTLYTVDHYGNLSAHPNAYIKPEELGASAEDMATKKPKDYLMALDETSASKGKTRKLFCFHDFPGADSVDVVQAVDTTYSNCDALFLFFSADKVISPTPQDKSNVTKNVSALMTWLQNKQSNIKLKYIVLIVTKLDLRASVLANAETPLDYMGKYLGAGVIQALRSRVGKIFVTSSLGISKEDWIPQNTSLPILWLLEQEAKREL